MDPAQMEAAQWHVIPEKAAVERTARLRVAGTSVLEKVARTAVLPGKQGSGVQRDQLHAALLVAVVGLCWLSCSDQANAFLALEAGLLARVLAPRQPLTFSQIIHFVHARQPWVGAMEWQKTWQH